MRSKELLGMATAVLLAGCGQQAVEQVKLTDCENGPAEGSYTARMVKPESPEYAPIILGNTNDLLERRRFGASHINGDLLIFPNDKGLVKDVKILLDPKRHYDSAIKPIEGESVYVRIGVSCDNSTPTEIK